MYIYTKCNKQARRQFLQKFKQKTTSGKTMKLGEGCELTKSLRRGIGSEWVDLSTAKTCWVCLRAGDELRLIRFFFSSSSISLRRSFSASSRILAKYWGSWIVTRSFLIFTRKLQNFNFIFTWVKFIFLLSRRRVFDFFSSSSSESFWWIKSSSNSSSTSSNM